MSRKIVSIKLRASRLQAAATKYANAHTDYHERSCGSWAEERLHEAIIKAFKAGAKRRGR